MLPPLHPPALAPFVFDLDCREGGGGIADLRPVLLLPAVDPAPLECK
jgi:hypothetical protein